MPAATIDQYRDHLPTEIISVWETYGTGLVGDGFLRLIDPVTFIEDGGVYLRSGVPVFVTALCDTIMYVPQTGSFTDMKLRWGAMDIVSPLMGDITQALRSLADPAFQLGALESRHYGEAVQRLGFVPDIDTGLNYVPMLALGGPHVSSTLSPGALVVSQSLLIQADPPTLRYYAPDAVEPRADYGVARG